MSATAEPFDPGVPPVAERRCDQCGRLVKETMHSRASYAVDCFALHTGETEPAVVRRSDSDEVALVFQRLVRPVLLITCADCYADPVRRQRHQSWAYAADEIRT